MADGQTPTYAASLLRLIDSTSARTRTHRHTYTHIYNIYYHLRCLLATPYRTASAMRSSCNSCSAAISSAVNILQYVERSVVSMRADRLRHLPTNRRCSSRKAPFRKLNSRDVPTHWLSGLILEKYGPLPTKITNRNHQSQVIKHK